MQNLSFLAIISVLLSFAFFFSQQTKSNLQSPLPEASQTPDSEVITPKTLEDVPDCTGLESVEESLSCYKQAASISQQLLDSEVDAILEAETDSQRRLDFMELQLAWEESRDKECAFLQQMSQNEDETSLNEAVCLSEHNLSRLEQLESYYCEWYDPSACNGEN